MAPENFMIDVAIMIVCGAIVGGIIAFIIGKTKATSWYKQFYFIFLKINSYFKKLALNSNIERIKKREKLLNSINRYCCKNWLI